MSELPASWVSAELGDITTISPKFDADEMKDESIVHFVPMAAASEDFGGVDVSQLRPLREVRKGYTFFAEGDVLFAKITPCMENGKGGLVPRLSHKHAFGSTEFHVLRPSVVITPHWLAHFLSQEEFRKVARHNMTGTAGQLRVPAKWLGTVNLPIPPLAEQTRIVEKLEELLGGLNTAVAELKAAQRKLASLRQSLLKAAVEGALTAQWRNTSRRRGNDGIEETGTELLARILRERCARWEARQLAKFAQTGKPPPKNWQAKYPEPVAPDAAHLPTLPDGWVWATIDQLAQVGTGVTPLRSNRAYFDGGDIPWTTSGALNDELVTATSEHVTQLALEKCRLEVYPAGSLLVAMYGEGKTRGKCAELGFPSTINQAIAAIVFEDTAIAVRPHVKTVLLDAYEAMRKQASGGVQPNLNLRIIKALLVPLPSLEEQTQIIATLDTALPAVKDQEAAIAHGLRQAAAQRRNLLRAAFAGQLVPQDPTDEPASELLARIHATRKAALASRRVRKEKEHA